jgi:hypothetical protein
MFFGNSHILFTENMPFVPYQREDEYDVPSSPIIKDYNVPIRPDFGSTGKKVVLKVNAYPITQFPTCVVIRYDVCEPFSPCLR